MMTGQYPARLHITDWISGHERPFAPLLPPEWTKHMPLETVTVAERLKTARLTRRCGLSRSTKPGTTCDEPVITPDIPATIFSVTGVGSDPKQPLDGRDLSGVLAGGRLDRDAIYWHYPHYHPGGATPYSAVLAGSWRLVHFWEDDHDELFDLEADPGETTDLAAIEPERVAALRQKLSIWLIVVDAQWTGKNPDADPERDWKPKRKQKPKAVPSE
jgi:arylsulfatase A-like enzyme